MVKLFLFDVDGVMTNGTKLYGKDGLCIGKNFCDLDWTALKRFKAAGVDVEAITGDNWNSDILYNRNISFTLSRGKRKEDFLPEICERNNVKLEEIAYVGDDIFDIGLLELVGYPFAPKNATRDIIPSNEKFSPDTIILKRNGGEGVIDEIFYYLRDGWAIEKFPFREEFQKVLQFDTKQKF